MHTLSHLSPHATEYCVRWWCRLSFTHHVKIDVIKIPPFPIISVGKSCITITIEMKLWKVKFLEHSIQIWLAFNGCVGIFKFTCAHTIHIVCAFALPSCVYFIHELLVIVYWNNGNWVVLLNCAYNMPSTNCNDDTATPGGRNKNVNFAFVFNNWCFRKQFLQTILKFSYPDLQLVHSYKRYAKLNLPKYSMNQKKLVSKPTVIYYCFV